ncbi:MAG: hypothetical protein OEW82_03180 [Dehalococcoidia bacterium]|nr:hypothetical protein [Dehalococcoidia bacterium]
MSDNNTQSSGKVPLLQGYWIGQELDWEAPSIPVDLRVELPFWIMVPDCVQDVDINGHKFSVEIKDNYVELYAGAVVDSRYTCVYFGPPRKLDLELKKAIKKSHAPVLSRKCKTVLLIHSACNKDVLTAAQQEGKRSRPARHYLKSFCAVHIEIVNRLMQQYRLSTYDLFSYEVSPWDVPIWFIGSGGDAIRVVLQDYRAWDEKPVMYSSITASKGERYKLIDAAELQSAMSIEPSAGEYELLDALNFMERGDYSGAVRRIVTAIEVQLESALRQEFLKLHPVPEVNERLEASENDFPGRLRQYQKLSRRKLSATLGKELEATRAIRHSIVHNAYRIPFSQSQQTKEAIDTGRWIFNWLENQPARKDVREKRIAKRHLGSYFSLFSTEITPTGVIVHKPTS